jgi:G3E family GTPase
MASYRYTSFKFDRANIAQVDADAKAGLPRFLTAREAEINTISTRSFICGDGPFEGMTVEQDTQAGGFLPLDFKGWIGSYIEGKWQGTTGEPLSKIDQSESTKAKDFELGRGFEQLGDLFAQMSEDPAESSVSVPCRAQVTITHNGQDDFGFELASPVRVGIWHIEQHYMGALKKGRGRARDVYKYISTPHNQTLTSSAFMDDFGTLHNAPGLAGASSITIPAQKQVITYTIGRTAYTVGATALAIDKLRAKILAKKRWFADKLLSKKTLSVTDKAAQDVAQVVASAQAMAAIEQASESSALQELASDTSTEQAASQADDVQELAIVGEQVQQASQHAPGAPGGSVGHTSTTSTSSAHQVASSTHAQAINSRSGAWSALFFVSDSGAPSMKFKQTGRVPCIVEFESGRDRMRALQQSAKWADEAAARQADDAAAHDGARVCATPPASQAPEQSTPVLNSETPQDQNTDEIRSRWQNFACDIPVSMAINAYRGTSMSPERRGASAQNEYGQSMAADFETLQAQAVKGGTLALLPDVFARYRARQASSYKAYLSSSARCVSSFIAGPANFPAARMNKRSDIAHRRLNEYLDGGKMALRAAIRTLRPDLRAIMAGDVDAIDRLTVKIDNAERLQSRMRDANKAIRTHAKKGAAQQVEALMTLGFTEQQASDLLKPDFCGRIGFAAYELTNNNANIRRMHERLEQISKAQATEVQAVACSNGVTLEDDAPANRVRLYFPGKPSEEIRTELKSSGFRWAPSGGAWQAYRNNSTLATAKRMAGEPVSAPTEDSATVCAAEPESQAPEQAGPVLESESPQDQAQAEKEAGRVSDFQKSYIDDAGKQGLDGANKLLLVIRSTPSQAVAKYAQSVFDAMPIEPDSKARTDAQAVESKTPQDQGPLHPRNFIPGNGVHIVEEAFEAWTYQREARFGFVMYLGKQSKPYAYYSYATEAKRDDGFTRHATQARDILANKAKRKAETKAKLDQGHSLQVGDVVRSSWGYDQTNIDHYQIVRVIGKRTVEVRKIAEHHEATGDMTGRSAPIPGEFVGEVMRRQVDQWGNVNILSASYGRASKIEPLAVVHGVRCYAAAAYSSYA